MLILAPFHCAAHSSFLSLNVLMALGQVYCLDGDGALTMHMGSLTTIAQHQPVWKLICRAPLHIRGASPIAYCGVAVSETDASQ
jgi:hypothetical protein